jgi:hypothetical protein
MPPPPRRILKKGPGRLECSRWVPMIFKVYTSSANYQLSQQCMTDTVLRLLMDNINIWSWTVIGARYPEPAMPWWNVTFVTPKTTTETSGQKLTRPFKNTGSFGQTASVVRQYVVEKQRHYIYVTIYVMRWNPISMQVEIIEVYALVKV